MEPCMEGSVATREPKPGEVVASMQGMDISYPSNCQHVETSVESEICWNAGLGAM